MPPTRKLRWPVFRRSPSAEIEIRRIEDQDLESLNRLLTIWSSREYAKRFAAQRRGEMVQVVAWDGAVPVGRGMVLFPTHEEWSISALRERCCEVRDVSVVPSHRRRDIARSMMELLEHAARGAGAVRIGLSVGLAEDDAPARALYEGLGYRHAHGPMITSVNLDGDEGPIPVAAPLMYLVKDL
jgi:GNAT superfamily N-acetyltransferase